MIFINEKYIYIFFKFVGHIYMGRYICTQPAKNSVL